MSYQEEVAVGRDYLAGESHAIQSGNWPGRNEDIESAVIKPGLPPLLGSSMTWQSVAFMRDTLFHMCL